MSSRGCIVPVFVAWVLISTLLSFPAVAQISDPAWNNDDPEDTELAATKNAWAVCLKGCVLVPSTGDSNSSVALAELKSLYSSSLSPLAKLPAPRLLARFSLIASAEASTVEKTLIRMTDRESAAAAQKTDAYPYLGFTPIVHWMSDSNVKDDLWRLRRTVHRTMFFRKGSQTAPVIEFYPIDSTSGPTNVFATPTWDPQPRLRTKEDPEGGIFTSAREHLGGEQSEAEVIARYGKNARRLHAATDFLMPPGQTVLAPLSGTLTLLKYNKKEKQPKTGKTVGHTVFDRLTIHGNDGVVATLLYVVPSSSFKPTSSKSPLKMTLMHVEAGVTILGVADDLQRSPGYARDKVPNHVHVHFVDKLKRKFDPYSNQVVEVLTNSGIVRPRAPTNVTAN